MAFNTGILLLLCFLILSSFTDSFIFPIAQARNGGFSIDLVRRDSLKSPFHIMSSSSGSSSNSLFDRLRRAFDRSVSRAAYFQNTILATSTIQSPISSTGGEYVISVAIGTPPRQITAIADTGSDVAWTQCKPCRNCFRQNDPLFDPNRTSTYRKLSCQASACAATGASGCDSNGGCRYRLSYGDGSTSVGELASDTFTFGSTSGHSVSILNVIFGCGHENSGTFASTGASGILGLGGGELSIVKQLDAQIDGKFSYCLVPIFSEANVSSKINFGSNAEIHNPAAVTTPLIKKTPDTFYFLNLEKVSVGTKTLAYKSRASSSSNINANSGLALDEGNIIIDSGTTLTFLPRDFYEELESTLRETINAQTETDPQGLFGLCYNAGDIKFPDIVLHFTGADVKLPPTNTFLEVSQGLVCLTIIPADDVAILGNISQMDFLIEYDLVNQQLSFFATDCTKQ